ncbi:hypothetical protein C4K04_1647 [Pseudomonas chlororaphis]|uniref:Uncharacterized protein n=1 Tax=Pseudomonas chlororaphis TaxID=587753 RepID=A0A3G7TJR0_9PSED|nr:hypothetical protein C4K04_1647 [Pseudomonas chlororaphis]
MRLNELKPLCGKGWLGHASAGQPKIAASDVKQVRQSIFLSGFFSCCPVWGVTPLNNVACPAV